MQASTSTRRWSGSSGRRRPTRWPRTLDMHTVGDLVRHYPRRYVERGQLTDIAGPAARRARHGARRGREGHHAGHAPAARQDAAGRHARRARAAGWTAPSSTRTSCSGVIMPGPRALFAGQVGVFRGKLQLTHPQFEPLTDERRASARSCRSTRPPQRSAPGDRPLRAPGARRCSTTRPTRCPRRCASAEGLAELGRALRRIHVPETEADHHAAQHRLVWDEAMGVQLALALRRQAAVARPAAAVPAAAGRPAGRVRRPAAVHADRRASARSGAEIAADLARDAPDEPAGAGRRRRRQDGRRAAGDAAGRRRRPAGRACWRRPRCWPPSTPARCARCSARSAQAGELGGGRRRPPASRCSPARWAATARRQALLDAQSGAAGIVVGTHALIQDQVGFADLGLVVVDEQHRFGVEQRDALRGRGELAPHMLVMTATPIPRTVAMTVYGDLEVSALRELPGGRSPIATTVVPLAEKPAWLDRVWGRVREEVEAGHQVYVVCPRVGGDAGKRRRARRGAGRPGRDEPTPESAARRWPCSTSRRAGRGPAGRACGSACCTASCRPTRRTP